MISPLGEVTVGFENVKRRFDAGVNDFESLGTITDSALMLLESPGTEIVAQGQATLEGQVKLYELRKLNRNISRPIRQDLFIADRRRFSEIWREINEILINGHDHIEHSLMDAALYTSAIAFSVAYDLYQPTSRKTPGTFFEVLIGTLLGAATQLYRGKQIRLPDSRYMVTTDIVLIGENDRPSLVVPTKITTRERIVQPWAHQRILDDAFGRGRYKSVLVAVSELQRNGDKGVNEICVPGQVGLYQRYLAQMYGMYYLDPPAAYVRADFAQQLPTRRLSSLLSTDLIELLEI